MAKNRHMYSEEIIVFFVNTIKDSWAWFSKIEDIKKSEKLGGF